MSVVASPAIDLGLMGGMFDPVHLGHLQTARDILKHLELNAIHLLPCGVPVHREQVRASARHRLAMLALALADDDRIRVDDRECTSLEPSYTINSLEATRAENPRARLFCIMGQDAFNGLDTWRRWRDLFALAHIVVAARPGFKPDMSTALAEEFHKRIAQTVTELKAAGQGKIYLAHFRLLDISSSQVRKRIAANESLENLLPPSVAAYISANGLYTSEETP